MAVLEQAKILSSEEIKSLVADAITKFRRRDRIVYILKLERFTHIHDWVIQKTTHRTKSLEDASLIKKINKIRLSYIKEHKLSELAAASVYPNLEAELIHLMDTITTGRYRAANSLIWSNQPPQTLIAVLEQLIEDERGERISKYGDFIPLEDIEADAGVVILDCGDGYEWYLLQTNRQKEIEADLMSHCATSDRGWLLSLRKRDEFGLKALLTFEYIPDDLAMNSIRLPHAPNSKIDFEESVGVLGEMKGYANSKPSNKYHPYIMCLLEQPQILWVVGGGYREFNNFSLKDLSIQDQQALAHVRPDLFDSRILINYRRADIATWLESRKIKFQFEDDTLVLLKFDEIEEALEFISDEKVFRECGSWSRRREPQQMFDELLKYYRYPGELHFDVTRNANDILQELLRHIHGKGQLEIKLSSAILRRINKDKLDTTVDEVLELLKDGMFDEVDENILEDLQQAARNSEYTGWEVGTYNELASKMESLLPIELYDGSAITKDKLTGNLAVLIRKALNDEYQELIPDDDECKRISRILHQAFEAQDFDQEAAIESFFDSLDMVI